MPKIISPFSHKIAAALSHLCLGKETLEVISYLTFLVENVVLLIHLNLNWSKAGLKLRGTPEVIQSDFKNEMDL